MSSTVVDFRSDAITRPTPGMRRAIAEAEVGDLVFADCPQVARLEAMSAEITGKEAALYVPSGTMGNMIAVLAHCWGRGYEVLLGDMSHIHLFEQGGVSQVRGKNYNILC